jgi:hypothetical protein
MLTQTSVAERLTLVATVGLGSDGDSLAGQNVNNFPDGALFYVASSKRFYALQKNLPVTVVASGNGNVIDGVGSSSVAGRFVACLQSDLLTLSGGTLTQIGWSLPNPSGYNFLATLVNAHSSTTGFVTVARATDHSITVTSAQGADAGTYFVVLIPSGN